MIWDPLRKKHVAETPEEIVRQWFITRLLEDVKVPSHMMNSEVAFKYGDKSYRADILIFDRTLNNLAIVECKRPDIVLDEAVLDQVIRYNLSLDVKFIFVTNGRSTYVCRRNSQGVFEFMNSIPSYHEMLNCQ